MKLEKLMEELIPFTKNLGNQLLEAQKTLTEDKIKSKGLHNLVTEFDTFSEKEIIKKCHELLPNSTFLAEEETTKNQDSDLRWIIDPIDGTTNFIHGLPCFAISLALEEKGEIVLGIVHEINLNETFWAIKGKGAFLNQTKILVSNQSNLSESLIATGFPYTTYNRLDPYLQVFKTLLENSRGVRRLGSASVDLAYVACGRFEAFYEYGLSPWDVAAGALLITEAGGKITDFSGGNKYIFGGELLATNQKIHQDMQATIQQYF